MIILKILLWLFLGFISIFLIMLILPVKTRFRAFYLNGEIGGNITLYWIRPLLAVQVRYLDLKSLLLRLEIFYIPISKQFHFEKKEPEISGESQEPAETEPAQEKKPDGAKVQFSQEKETEVEANMAKAKSASADGEKMSQDEWEELADTVSGGEVDFSRDENGAFHPVLEKRPDSEKASWRQQFAALRQEYGPQIQWAWQLLQNQLFPMAKKAFRLKIRRIEGEIGLPEPIQTFELQRVYITLMTFLNHQLKSKEKVRWRYDGTAKDFFIDFIFSVNLLIIIIRLLLIWKEFKQAKAAGIIKI